MNPDQLKTEIQELLDADFNDWFIKYQPVKQTGKKGLKAVEAAGEEHSWTTIDEFVQDYLTLSDGTELSYVAVGITTGIQEGELFFTSNLSWEELADEDRLVNIEVIITCQVCFGNSAECDACDRTGEWVFVATPPEPNWFRS